MTKKLGQRLEGPLQALEGQPGVARVAGRDGEAAALDGVGELLFGGLPA